MKLVSRTVTTASLAIAAALTPAGSGVAAAAPARRLTTMETYASASAPGGLARDRYGDLYVSDEDADAVVVYHPRDAHPVRRIAGPSTGLHVPQGLAVDSSGAVYVADYLSGQVTVYGPGSEGDVAPGRVIGGPATGLVHPTDVRRDASGRLYVTDAGADSVSVFAPGATGDVAPARVISGSGTGLDGPSAVDRDRSGRLYVANAGADSLTVYAPGASGDAAPVRVLAGPHTRLHAPGAVAVDRAGRIHVGGHVGPRGRGALVAAFGRSAHGDVAPVRVISGAAEWGRSTGLFLDRVNRVWVSTDIPAGENGCVECDLREYTPLLRLVPSHVRHLRVSGARHARLRTVRWARPGHRGAAPVRRYLVTVKHAGHTVLTRRTRRHSITIARRRLRHGRDRVTVRAVNRYGRGAPAARTFRVAR